MQLTTFAEQLTTAVTEQEHQINQTYEVLMNFCANMAAQLTPNTRRQPGETALRYQNLKEITHLQTNFATFNQQDIGLLSLLKGLDKQSYHTVIRILQQINELNKAKSQSFQDGIDLYNDQEKQTITEFTRMFEPYILHVSQHYHQYKNYILPVNQFSALAFYFNYGLSALRHADTIKHKSVIDIGATAADSALIFQQLDPKSVYLFEDNPEQIALAQQTITLNHLTNTHIISPDDVNATDDTVDAYIKAAKINHIGLFKIKAATDIVPILQGATHTISTHKPTLIIHMDHNWTNFLTIKPFIESLNLGYQFRIFKPVNGEIIGGTLLIAEQPAPAVQ